MRIDHLYRIIVSFLLFQFSAPDTIGQFTDPRTAKEHFNHGNYSRAISVYKKLLQKDRNNALYNHNLGLCYLRTNIDRKLAIPYLEKCTQLPKVDPEVYFDLGLAYHYALKFKEAIAAYNQYKESDGTKRQDLVDRKIEMCKNGKWFVRNKVPIIFEHLGPEINTKYPDYYPFVAKDESFIVFTSRRAGVLEFDGFYQSDIYLSTYGQTGYLKSGRGNANINSEFDDQAVGLSDNADRLFVYVDNIKEVGDIYVAKKDGKRIGKIAKLGSNVNGPKLETSCSVSADGNTLFFTSGRDGGEGGLDIYMSRRLPDGAWGLPQNLGSQINSKYNEDFPTLSADGQTLYFCSEGHNSMGGYDIFTSEWEAESNSWSMPENMGYPINDAMDNRTISFLEDGKTAYISALRPEGLGDLDIYRVRFPYQVLILLQLPTSDPDNPVIKDAYVQVDNSGLETPLIFTANQSTGYYTLVVNHPGVYNLKIEADGFQLYEETIDLDGPAEEGSISYKFVTLKPN
ncbi:MAG: PD40 domain-containing protein [Flavobacteriales bacterium]|nr:PD40 domain-containing protein [Flavobacteriales bacterium]